MNWAAWITLGNESASHWGDAMWRAGWQGGLFVALVWIVCRAWQRIPSTLRYGLWWLVCLKLLLGLCPIFLALPLLPPAPNPLPIIDGPASPSFRQTSTHPQTSYPANRPLTPPAVSRSQAQPRLSGMAWLLGIWLAVTGVLMGVSALSLHRLRRLRRGAEPLSDPARVAMAHEAAKAIGIRAVPELLVTQGDVGVLTLGARRPVVLLSERAVSSCSPAELQLVLAHEFAHIRRGDAWLGLLPHLTQILFWFHPLAWLACRELVLAREAACDELTISSLQARSDLYGRLLLKLGVRQASWFALCTPGVSSHFRILHRRISMLARISEGSSRRRQGHVILFVCLAGVAIMAPWNIVRAQNPATKTSGATPERTAATSRQVAAGNKAIESYERAFVKQIEKSALASQAGKKTAAIAGSKPTVPGIPRPLPKVAQNQPIPGLATGIPSASLPPSGMDTKPETRVIRLKFADADTAANTLTTLFGDKPGKSVKIVPDVRTNSIIIQAVPEKIREMLAILDELDTEATSKQPEKDLELKIFPLKHTLATHLSTTLTTLFGNKKEKPAKIVADEATNSIIVQAAPDQIEQILRLLVQLDVEAKRP